MNFVFDGNEWFMLGTSFAAVCLFLSIRKHFRPVALFTIWLFQVAQVETVDYALAASPFEAYYCADNETYEPAAAVIHLFLYPCFAFFFLYFYDKLKIRGSGERLAAYLAVWTAISIAFEWINVLAGVFTYTGWKLLYSIPVYPIAQLVLLALSRFLEKYTTSYDKS
jgi:hypothetical protein